jgi:hypothetical protein
MQSPTLRPSLSLPGSQLGLYNLSNLNSFITNKATSGDNVYLTLDNPYSSFSTIKDSDGSGLAPQILRGQKPYGPTGLLRETPTMGNRRSLRDTISTLVVLANKTLELNRKPAANELEDKELQEYKGKNVLDVFYHNFFGFNWGGLVLGKNMGNHIGDWEHVMIRFVDQTPKYVWLSQHIGGQAFHFKDMEKDAVGLRPIVYIANGSHANYAVQGPHDHTIAVLKQPNRAEEGLLTDYTDNGTLFSPLASSYYFKWKPHEENQRPRSPETVMAPEKYPGLNMLFPEKELGVFESYESNAYGEEGVFYFKGRWGNEAVSACLSTLNEC